MERRSDLFGPIPNDPPSVEALSIHTFAATYHPLAMTLLASVLETDGYVVGSNNGPSGLHVFDGATWHHRGWRNVRAFSVATGSASGEILMACGNGLLRSADNGHSWRVESDWRLTEALDVQPLDNPRGVLLATAHGVWLWDEKHTFHEMNDGLVSRFVSHLVLAKSPLRTGTDKTGAVSAVLAGTECGVAVLDLGRRKWSHAGPPFPTRTVATTDHGRRWVAGFEWRGVAESPDAGATWIRQSALSETGTSLESDSIYALAISRDPEHRLVAGGLAGVIWTRLGHEDAWRALATPGDGDAIHSLAFDESGTRLYCGCGKTGLYVLDPTTGELLSRALDRAFVSRIVSSSTNGFGHASRGATQTEPGERT